MCLAAASSWLLHRHIERAGSYTYADASPSATAATPLRIVSASVMDRNHSKPSAINFFPEDPPSYYDSEQLNQPPTYKHPPTADPTSRRSVSTPTPPRPGHHPTGSGAPASSVSAILAYPSGLQTVDEKSERRSLKERYRDWKERYNELGPRFVSAPVFNVQGIGIRSWSSITPASTGPRKR